MSIDRPAVMTRFGGRPYWTGADFRCPECNGVFADGRCQTCGAVPSVRSAERPADVVGNYTRWRQERTA